MGRPSDQRRRAWRSAQRPGRRERARRKKRTRAGYWCSGWGGGTDTVYLGRKKFARVFASKLTRLGV